MTIRQEEVRLLAESPADVLDIGLAGRGGRLREPLAGLLYRDAIVKGKIFEDRFRAENLGVVDMVDDV